MNNHNCSITGRIDSKYELVGNIMETILVGLSAYEVAVKNGFEGTEQEWLNSLSVHVEVVSDKEHEYILSITTSDGTFLTPNLKPILIKGVDYLTPEEVQELVEEVTNSVKQDIDTIYQRKEEGKSLVSDEEIERLSKVDNYDDTEIREEIDKKVDKEDGKSLIADSEIERLATLKNYDDTEIREELENKANKNHSHVVEDITNFPSSMPASDVYPWAKEEDKPSYTKAEIGLSNVDNTSDADKPMSTIVSNKFNEVDEMLNDIGDALDEKAEASDLTTHTSNSTIHVTTDEKNQWNDKSKVEANTETTEESTNLNSISIDGVSYKLGTGTDVDERLNTLEEEMKLKADDSTLQEHVEDENVHVTPNDKERWDDKTKVIANPTLSGEETDLNSVQIGDTKYKIQGTGGATEAKDVIYTPNDKLQEANLQDSLDYIMGRKVVASEQYIIDKAVSNSPITKMYSRGVLVNTLNGKGTIGSIKVLYLSGSGNWRIGCTGTVIADGKTYTNSDDIVTWLSTREYHLELENPTSAYNDSPFVFAEDGKSLVSTEEKERWDAKTTVTPNPSVEGDEETLTTIQIGEDKFKLDGSEDAKDIAYDNTESKLEGTNVQSVLDELAPSKVIELTKAEYDALPDSKNEDNITYYISDIGGGGASGGSSKIDYSTEEQDTGTKWLDGKTIYQKTFEGSFTLAGNDFTNIASIYMPYGDKIIKCEMHSGNTAIQPTTAGIATNGYGTDILAVYLSRPTLTVQYITVYYTKKS